MGAKNETLKLTTLFSVVLGKIMIALGLTPSLGLPKETQQSLFFYGSLVQINGDALDAEFLRGDSPDKIGTQLQAFGYVLVIYAFIVLQDQYKRLKVFQVNNFMQVLAGVIILSDRNVWKKNYLAIGNIIIILGNFIMALGRNDRLRSIAPLAYIDPLETRGGWTQATGAAIIFLGEVEKSMRNKKVEKGVQKNLNLENDKEGNKLKRTSVIPDKSCSVVKEEALFHHTLKDLMKKSPLLLYN
ncbi:DUF6944 family repetitive protein [Sporolactobacillus putidus]|uniref:Uncharacterized protein n=1 Tax=Sporolactobacillus putidus TaxID=492735 RepID=A0A917W4B9_9BACL|nr:hypothetical protein [Sporolactobacillus putidus]GGL62075.1 hypothetical protein GCM10007968_27580 [Sporolactobacillus putidus]